MARDYKKEYEVERAKKTTLMLKIDRETANMFAEKLKSRGENFSVWARRKIAEELAEKKDN